MPALQNLLSPALVCSRQCLWFRSRPFPRGEASACMLVGFSEGRTHCITHFSASCHPVLFLKIPSPGARCTLQSLCLILRTHIIKLKLNSMKIIPTITVVANLSLARVKVARQGGNYALLAARGRRDVQGLHGCRSLRRRELHSDSGILTDCSALH